MKHSFRYPNSSSIRPRHWAVTYKLSTLLIKKPPELSSRYIYLRWPNYSKEVHSHTCCSQPPKDEAEHPARSWSAHASDHLQTGPSAVHENKPMTNDLQITPAQMEEYTPLCFLAQPSFFISPVKEDNDHNLLRAE